MAKQATKEMQPTVMTLTFAGKGGEQRSGTLLIERGELAHLRQFTYTSFDEVLAAMKAASNALVALEMNPPQIDDSSKKRTSQSKQSAQKDDAESNNDEGVTEDTDTDTVPDNDSSDEADDNDDDQTPLF